MNNAQGGRVVNSRYELLYSLSKGSQGNVYYARDLGSNNTFVAVKESKLNIEARIDACTVREQAQVVNVSSHPNIVNYYDMFLENNCAYVVMEYMETDLFELLGKHDKLPPHIVPGVVKQILQGLGHLHASGIAHRDIKPENVMAKENNLDSLEIKLVDLGLSHPFTDDNDFTSTMCGSRAYMSPEVLGGCPFYSARSADVWAVGILMYNLYTSFSPWAAAVETDEIFKTFLTQPGSFWMWTNLHTGRSVETDFMDLFFGMCAVDPSKRLSVEECLSHPFFHSRVMPL